MITLSAASSANAQRFLEAGWDFSQYSVFLPGFPTLDGGATFVNTLSANYSDNATVTSGAGPSAEPFGTLYYDGSFGSSFSPLPLGSVGPTINLTSNNTNIDRSNDSFVAFDSYAILIDEGQPNANPFGLGISADFQVFSLVFALNESHITLATPLDTFSFAGYSINGVTSVSLEYSTDGFAYSFVDNFILTNSDQTFSTDLWDFDFGGYVPVYFRLNFNLNTADAVIDNVAIHTFVPEPQTYAVLLGLSMLVATVFMRKKSR